jgi:hypothetical protein
MPNMVSIGGPVGKAVEIAFDGVGLRSGLMRSGTPMFATARP